MGFLHETEHAGALLVEQAADLATPAAGRKKVYTKSGGLYMRDSAGTVVLFATSAGGMADAVILAPSTSARNTIQPTADVVPITAKRFNAGATSNLYEAQAETGAVLAAIDKSGVIVSPIHAPLADSTTAIRITKADKTTDVVRIDTTNGRVGIGITPTQVLHVKKDQNATTGMTVANATDGAASVANIVVETVGGDSLTLFATAPAYSGVSAWTDAAVIAAANFPALIISNYTSTGAIKFQTGGTGSGNIRLTIDSTGQVLVNGFTSATIGLVVRGAASQSANLQDWQTSAPTTVASVDKDGQGLFAGLTITEAKNIILGTTTGTKIGTVGGASGQKLAFWGSTAIVQPVLATGAGRTVDEVITVLQNLGLVRQS